MTRKEAEEQGFEILTYDEAIEIIAENTYRNVNGSGVNGMSREDVQDWFVENDLIWDIIMDGNYIKVIFDWQLEG